MDMDEALEAEGTASTAMDEGAYLRDRLDDQLNWYDRKSGLCQRNYKRMRAVEIACAALIPFMVGPLFDRSDISAIVAGGLGVTVSILAGLMTLYNFQEDWIKYRTTAESLKHEKFLYLTKTGPYGGEDPFPLLVQRVESLVSKENTEWAGNMATEKKERKQS